MVTAEEIALLKVFFDEAQQSIDTINLPIFGFTFDQVNTYFDNGDMQPFAGHGVGLLYGGRKHNGKGEIVTFKAKTKRNMRVKGVVEKQIYLDSGSAESRINGCSPARE